MENISRSSIDVLYILAQRDYFLCGIRGRVSHAKGFVKGLEASGRNVHVLTGRDPDRHIEESDAVQLSSPRYHMMLMWWLSFLGNVLLKVPRAKLVVIRWKPMWFLWGLPFLAVFRKKVWFEINALTGVSSKFFPVRLISRLSVRVAVSFFKVIVVSEVAREVLVRNYGAKKVSVIPNGFHGEIFSEFKPKFEGDAVCSLVYFGKKQPYYDWHLVFSALDHIVDAKGRKPELHIFGFYDQEIYGVKFRGNFSDQKEMLREVSLLTNPVMILPASDSPMARSGSPMKLFEYAALGVPVIISDSLRLQTKCLEGVNFYKAGSSKDFIRVLSRITDNYSDFYDKAAGDKEIAFNNYSWRSVVGKWVDSVDG